ncbi:hypothetical protein, partial [Burkholderia gladioli]|uniref:hypothetical protein n=1 Tax=Burkholderia gladioli TaxID=28095 RepID=UPI003F78B2F4
ARVVSRSGKQLISRWPYSAHRMSFGGGDLFLSIFDFLMGDDGLLLEPVSIAHPSSSKKISLRIP